jgi:hypothetical protein
MHTGKTNNMIARQFWIGVLSFAATQALAADRTFTCRNWIERDWPRTLVNYDIDAKAGEFVPGQTELMDGAGAPVESQLTVVEKYPNGSLKKGRVSFYSELKKGTISSNTLKSAAQPKAFPARVTETIKGDVVEVVSSETGVRLPAAVTKTFKEPVDIKTVPAPILGWRLANGAWAGKTWLESDRKVTGWSQRVVADGPLYKEYAYEVTFAPEGRYSVRVRVEAELPLVHVAEEYDMGSATAGKDFFVLALNEGWKPDTAFYAADRPTGEKLQVVRPRRVEHDSQVWIEPLDFTADREHSQLYPAGDWGSKAQWYSLLDGKADAASPLVGIMTEHTGAWRLPNQSLSLFQWTKSGQVLAKMRLSNNLGGAPQNPFSSEEIDPSLPQSLGRRMWSLVLGPKPGLKAAKVQKDGKEVELQLPDPDRLDLYRGYYGFISLDQYKDWILAWQEKDLPRPRAVATPESLAKIKANLDRWPGKELLKDTFLVSGDPQKAAAEARRAIQSLDSRLGQSLPFFMSHYRQTQFDYDSVFSADSALACKELPPELRETLRAKVAAVSYMLANADFTPRGGGMHMGNPNMAVNRYMGLPMYATIIQDHPMAKPWLDDAAVYVKWKTSFNVASGGGTFRENPGYATYGPTIFLSTAAIALRNAGYDLDRFEPLKDIGRYFRDIDTPLTAPRGVWRKDHLEWLAARKVRVLPGFGNGSDVAGGQTEYLLASLTAKADPAFAAEMLSSWEESGAYFGTEQVYPGFWFYWNPDLQPVLFKRTDKMVAGFGGILRSHPESPDETYVCLRQGYTQSHWNPDQGTFVLYARGVCLCPPTGWGYSGTQGICHDSRICFGDPLADHEHGRVDTGIEDYGSTPSVGYLLGRQTFKQRWDKTKTLQADFDWSRQVVMIRSTKPDGANYVVMRDSTQGPSPLKSWWYQWLVAKAENVKPVPGGVQVEAADGVKLDIRFVEPANPQVIVKGTKVQGFQEDYSQISVEQEPGRGYLAVFYPSKGQEPGLQKAEKLADGVVKVTTPESVDYVFCAVEKPVVFKDDVVDINAFAGAVRIFKDKALLVNGSGQFGSVAYKGVKAEGLGPFEHTTTLAPAKAGTVDVGRKIAKVDKPKGEGTLIAVDGSGTNGNPDIKGTGLKGWVLVQGGKATYAITEGSGKVGFKDFYIKGEAPFVCVHEPGKVTLTVEGRRRIFQMPIPENIVPAKLLPPRDSLPESFQTGMKGGWLNWPWAVDVKVDGVSVQAGWYDGLMAVGLDDGRHEAVITPYSNPPVWNENAYTRLLPVSR